MEFGAIFSGMSAAAVAGLLKSLLRNTRGIRRALLLELRKNIDLIALYTRGGAPIDKVVARLEVSRYEAAVQSNFNFNSFKKKPVAASLVSGAPQLQPYIGWTTEQLFESIYLKIHALKSIVAVDPHNERLRLNVRLINVLKLMLLLLKHLKS